MMVLPPVSGEPERTFSGRGWPGPVLVDDTAYRVGQRPPPSRTPGLPVIAHPKGSSRQSDCRGEPVQRSLDCRSIQGVDLGCVIRPDRGLRQFDGSIV